MRLGILRRAALVAGLFFTGAPALALTLDFDDLAHGEVVESERYDGVRIHVENEMQPFDLAVGFSTNATLSADPDLHGPDWSGGNLAPTTDLGRVLIIQANSFGCADGVCDVADDQAGVPAGMLTFDFDEPITRFGFDLVDLEGPFAPQTSVSFFSGEVLIGRIYFDDEWHIVSGDGKSVGPVMQQLYDSLVSIQKGESEDSFGWLHEVEI